MYNYIEGNITDKNELGIVLFVMGIGYNIVVPDTNRYKIGDKTTVYIYTHAVENECTLYGFTTREERDLYIKLLKVKGLGPKVCLGFFKCYSVSNIISAINKGDVEYLKKVPKVGTRLAEEMILHLKGKLTTDDDNKYEELISILTKLEFKKEEINEILSNIDTTWSLNIQVKEAIRILSGR